MESVKNNSHWFELIRNAPHSTINDELEASPVLLNFADESGHTALFYFAQDYNVPRGDSLMELFLSRGADINITDSLNQTSLFFAARFGHNEQIEMLVSHGASINHRDSFGQTALYYSAREGLASTVQCLIALGADVNNIDKFGQSALFYACRHSKLSCAKVLVESGSEVNIKDKKKMSPLAFARKSKNQPLVKLLIDNGANGSIKKKEDVKNEKIVKCQLMIVDDYGEKKPATEEEKLEFEEKFPQIASYWLHPSKLKELDSYGEEDVDKIKPWKKPAGRLMDILWKSPNAGIFHEKVDPLKLGIPDYLEVVKQPMDFGTIQKKLRNNVYDTAQEVLSDIELVFFNCKLYNGTASEIYVMCKSIQDVYENQLPILGLDKYKR